MRPHVRHLDRARNDISRLGPVPRPPRLVPLRPFQTHDHRRHQLVLDFSRDKVVDHTYHQLEGSVKSAHVEYVKWNMSRHLTEIFSVTTLLWGQGEVLHRFMLSGQSKYKNLKLNFLF